MRMYKSLFLLVLTVGIIILLIGVYLSLEMMSSGGYSAGRSGIAHYSQLTGFGGIFIGILLMLISIWLYKLYKTEKKIFDEME